METAVVVLVVAAFAVGVYFLVKKADKANPKKAYNGERVVKDPNVKKEVE